MNISRRQVLGTLAASGAAALLPSAVQAQKSSSAQKATKHGKSSKFIKPKALQSGMTIGVACPAGWTQMPNLELGKASLEALGFTVVFGALAGKQYGYLSGTDKERAAELMGFVERKDVDAIICARGGYGIMRMLPLLDFARIRKNPKIICGYSDITALVNTVNRKSGLVCLHGPGATSTLDPFTVQWLMAVASTDDDRKKQGFTPLVLTPPAKESAFAPFQTITAGKARGRLAGGNLTLLANTMGTPFEVDTKGSLLFFEDVTEEPYRIDRMVTQLLIAGKFKHCAGIAIGQFTKCTAEDPAHSFTIAEILQDRLSGLGIPVVSGLQFGHIAAQYTLPIGVNAELDATAGTLTLLESAVV